MHRLMADEAIQKPGCRMAETSKGEVGTSSRLAVHIRVAAWGLYCSGPGKR